MTLAVSNATTIATPTNTKTMHLKARKTYKKQGDRYLKRLSEQDRRIQEYIRQLIILQDADYLWVA